MIKIMIAKHYGYGNPIIEQGQIIHKGAYTELKPKLKIILGNWWIEYPDLYAVNLRIKARGEGSYKKKWLELVTK